MIRSLSAKQSDTVSGVPVIHLLSRNRAVSTYIEHSELDSVYKIHNLPLDTYAHLVN